MNPDKENGDPTWKAKLLRFKAMLCSVLRAPELHVHVEDAVLLEGAVTHVRWRSTGAFFVVVKGYGRCRRKGSMRLVVGLPSLALTLTAYGLRGKRTVRVHQAVVPITLTVAPPQAAPFRAVMKGPVPAYTATTLIQLLDLEYAKPMPVIRNELPVLCGRMPRHIQIDEPDLNQQHVVQGLLNA